MATHETPLPGSAWDSPLNRLSRFDGETFHPVSENSVDAPFVHVFAHGWQPGYWLQERLLAVGDAVPALPAWDPRLIDASGRTLSSYYRQLLEALAELGEDHAVLHYSWLDESATDKDMMLAFRSRQATQVNGRRLALALQQSLGRPDARLHLIGHSHGSAVAVHAAAALGRPPEHVTLLDAPESTLSRLGGAANLIDVVLPRIYPARDGRRPFVDSYSTVFGRPYHRKPDLSAVVDVVLTTGLASRPNVVETVNWAHLYGVDWYATSVREADRGVGYGWSPLNGKDVNDLHPAYYSLWPRRPLDLTRRPDPPQIRQPRPDRRTHRTTDVRLRLNPTSPAAAQVLHLHPHDGLIEFDLDITGGDGSEQIQIDLDAVTVFVAEARHRVPRSGRYILLADGKAGDRLLTARLMSTPGSTAKALITGVTIQSWPDASPGFTFERAAGAVFASGFVSGAMAGGIAALLARETASWLAGRLLRRLS